MGSTFPDSADRARLLAAAWKIKLPPPQESRASLRLARKAREVITVLSWAIVAVFVAVNLAVSAACLFGGFR